ncbi:hypothetical protein LTR50_007747 [Elasticomyces elasticus]|nr:hypothetical protein LTR50_007747 [Elasticomyces elasticus]
MEATSEDLLDDIIAEEFRGIHTFKKLTHDGTTLVSTIDPANLQAMLALRFQDLDIGERRTNILYPVLGNSIFSSDGAFWEHSRALFRPQFSRDNVNDLEATERACDALIRAIGPTDRSGLTEGVALQPLLYNFTIDTASDFLFGESLNSQWAAINAADRKATETSLEARSNVFLKAFEEVSRTTANRFQLQGLYWLADGPKFRKAASELKRFTEHFVQRALDRTASGKSEDNKYNLLSALATQTKHKDELRNQVLAILSAGRDTTAALLAWCFVRLALHGEVFERLRSVVLRDFEPGKEITFRQLKGCRLLQHFIQEVLRLHPTVAINGRRANKDTILPVGGGSDQRLPIAIRKGQLVLFSVYLMHRRKDIWSEDALEFKLERWEKKVPAWQGLGFLDGPRICLGQQFALTETGYVLVRMLQHFDAIDPIEPEEMSKMKKGLGLTVVPAEGAAPESEVTIEPSDFERFRRTKTAARKQQAVDEFERSITAPAFDLPEQKDGSDASSVSWWLGRTRQLSYP